MGQSMCHMASSKVSTLKILWGVFHMLDAGSNCGLSKQGPKPLQIWSLQAPAMNISLDLLHVTAQRNSLDNFCIKPTAARSLKGEGNQKVSMQFAAVWH